MEIKQLQYFVTAADHGSLNQAARELYTTQPNVSKVIASLEKELGSALFERGSRGIRLTVQGELVYGHAMNILKHSNVLRAMLNKHSGRKFSVSGYQSSLLTKLMTRIYQEFGADELKYEYREGTVENITDEVADYTSELGVVYVAKEQFCCFKHIVEHKKLEFHPLAAKGICVYVGHNHPMYDREEITFSEMKGLKFQESTDDFYAMEHHIDQVSVGMIQTENLNNVFWTNCDYMINNLLLYTDVCCIGIDLVDTEYSKYDIKALKVKDSEDFLTFGYITLAQAELSAEAKRYIAMLKELLLTTENQ